MLREVDEQLEETVQSLLHKAELELFEFKVIRHKKNILMRILIDRPCGGITIEQCVQVNKAVYEKFDESGLLEEPFSLEVASPGVDYHLKTRKDFLRVLNLEIRFVLTKTENLKGEYVGILKHVNDDHVMIESKGEEILIPFDKIQKAQEHI